MDVPDVVSEKLDELKQRELRSEITLVETFDGVTGSIAGHRLDKALSSWHRGSSWLVREVDLQFDSKRAREVVETESGDEWACLVVPVKYRLEQDTNSVDPRSTMSTAFAVGALDSGSAGAFELYVVDV